MRKFLYKILITIFLILFLTVISTFIFINIPEREEDIGYMAAIIDKHELLQKSELPRMIFVGGSSVAFGIDSHMIENKLENYDVINMGLHAGIGLKGIFNDIKPYIKKDDIIIAMTEYEHFYGSLIHGEAEIVSLISYAPVNINYIDAKQFFSILKYYPIFSRRKIHLLLPRVTPLEEFDSIFKRKSFDHNGDFVGHLDKESQDISGYDLFENNQFVINDESIAYLINFSKFVEEKGAKFYLDYPYVPEGQYLKYKGEIDKVDELLRKEIESNIISYPQNNTLPEDQFFNTVYHLNKEGRYKRTVKLIEDMEQKVFQ